jgi:NADH:ubiquinone oxidoreductase subunit 5 (subunit L)/multisubunit Na+/H+ antiporter MnhA subunit
MLLALVAKSVQFPQHSWIPEAMAAPTPVSALLHAACYVKAGVYLAARMHSFGAWHANWGATMVWVGTVTMLVGVLCAMVQNDLKRMLAYSTVSQICYMITGIGIGVAQAYAADDSGGEHCGGGVGGVASGISHHAADILGWSGAAAGAGMHPIEESEMDVSHGCVAFLCGAVGW